jgi:uncharacterized protein YbaP (TraB family)
MLSVLSTTGMYPQGESLWDHVSPRTRSLLTGFCAENGLDAEMLSRFKPWAASATISMLLVKAAGMKPELGIDQHFLEQARGSKRVDQLETVEQQVRMLQQIPVREEEQSLAESIANPGQSKQFLSKMKAAWLDGDAAAIDLLLSTELKSSQALQKVMFGDRNSRMAAAVERYLKGNEPCFVVVGAGHLVGKDGVVSLLRHKGFTVQQVLAAN